MQASVAQGFANRMGGDFRGRRAQFRLAVFRWAAVLLAVVGVAACSGRKPEPIARGSVVLVLGDSITAGYGLSPEQSWVRTLAAETGWQIVNAGVSGDTTAGGLARLPTLLDEHRPQAVIVELGGNDMLKRLPSTQAVANLEAMLGEIRARGARPILMATPQPSIAGAVLSSLSDAPFYAEIAKRKEVPLIDDVLATVLSKSEYKLDQLHPNAEGHRRVGEAAAKRLRQAGLVGK